MASFSFSSLVLSLLGINSSSSSSLLIRFSSSSLSFSCSIFLAISSFFDCSFCCSSFFFFFSKSFNFFISLSISSFFSSIICFIFSSISIFKSISPISSKSNGHEYSLEHPNFICSIFFIFLFPLIIFKFKISLFLISFFSNNTLLSFFSLLILLLYCLYSISNPNLLININLGTIVISKDSVKYQEVGILIPTSNIVTLSLLFLSGIYNDVTPVFPTVFILNLFDQSLPSVFNLNGFFMSLALIKFIECGNIL